MSLSGSAARQYGGDMRTNVTLPERHRSAAVARRRIARFLRASRAEPCPRGWVPGPLSPGTRGWRNDFRHRENSPDIGLSGAGGRVGAFAKPYATILDHRDAPRRLLEFLFSREVGLLTRLPPPLGRSRVSDDRSEQPPAAAAPLSRPDQNSIKCITMNPRTTSILVLTAALGTAASVSASAAPKDAAIG